jgi:hypothetical protein
MVQDKHNLAYDVAKSGLPSGWTTGTIDAIASILNLRKDWESVVPIEIRQEPEAQDVQLGPTGKWPKKAVKNYHRPVLVVGIVPTDYYNGKILIESGDSGSVVLLKELNDDGVGATAVGLAFASSRASSVPCMTPMIHGLAEFRAIQRQGIFN